MPFINRNFEKWRKLQVDKEKYLEKEYLNNTLPKLPDFQIDSGIQRGSVSPPEGLENI